MAIGQNKQKKRNKEKVQETTYSDVETRLHTQESYKNAKSEAILYNKGHASFKENKKECPDSKL